jgi:hypothetical protein
MNVWAYVFITTRHPRKELDGYREYASRVCCRLLPSIW